MNTKEIKELLILVSELDLREVRIKNKDFDIKIRTDKDSPAQIVSASSVVSQPAHMSLTSAPPSSSTSDEDSASSPSSDSEEGGSYIEIRSPMVGTFYRSSSPDKPPYIQVGDNISKGDVVCIIEAMKLFNEIESEVAGKIVKVLSDDSTPVEYDQVLFLIDPSA